MLAQHCTLPDMHGTHNQPLPLGNRYMEIFWQKLAGTALCEHVDTHGMCTRGRHNISKQSTNNGPSPALPISYQDVCDCKWQQDVCT